MFENTDFIINENDNTLSRRLRALLASLQQFAALSASRGSIFADSRRIQEQIATRRLP